ncbi:uncharacterized protein BO95DRAFT_126952 [Aspergillus brunneoviolaceus CBS 621.78]|uniref:Uncharacterized protein n=1 Tax=Aspergillus brunneoviolaceus CBS 621.78 TaxID=1450534 RepID=A0ACD1G9V0_9EURO|nr:hypothetical protein BO95DRAFT_126952 [Aspergillus brunneoviolaceus CBS 621.78]RAH45919.1 hypothetical protein BO95DRAFT_126952 [Aspergillus brunneoviolaceus CBS 621.78]
MQVTELGVGAEIGCSIKTMSAAQSTCASFQSLIIPLHSPLPERIIASLCVENFFRRLCNRSLALHAINYDFGSKQSVHGLLCRRYYWTILTADLKHTRHTPVPPRRYRPAFLSPSSPPFHSQRLESADDRPLACACCRSLLKFGRVESAKWAWYECTVPYRLHTRAQEARQALLPYLLPLHQIFFQSSRAENLSLSALVLPSPSRHTRTRRCVQSRESLLSRIMRT